MYEEILYTIISKTLNNILCWERNLLRLARRGMRSATPTRALSHPVFLVCEMHFRPIRQQELLYLLCFLHPSISFTAWSIVKQVPVDKQKPPNRPACIRWAREVFSDELWKRWKIYSGAFFSTRINVCRPHLDILWNDGAGDAADLLGLLMKKSADSNVTLHPCTAW